MSLDLYQFYFILFYFKFLSRTTILIHHIKTDLCYINSFFLTVCNAQHEAQLWTSW